LKAKVYSDGFQAKSVPHLIQKIKKELKSFKTDYFRNLMKNIKKNIVTADRFGPLAILGSSTSK